MIALSAYPELVVGRVYVFIDGWVEILEGESETAVRSNKPNWGGRRRESDRGSHLLICWMRWPSSGRISFSIARRTAFSEPGMEKTMRPFTMPAVARLIIADDPIS